ncbi:DUF6527 family protein [Flavobacterium oreochromis]|uniref:DUF6527 family protein n=1 Tax=Flavobacterium oreochromis TaxID=2906078 RepID=UPI00385AE6A4
MKTSLIHKFVEFIPSELEEGTLYITVEYKTAVHLCVCGCGNKTITPITPNDWKLTYYGTSVSLSPSIGNWSFDCKSHYWIRQNEIIIASSWSSEKIDFGRKKDAKKKKRFFKKRKKD